MMRVQMVPTHDAVGPMTAHNSHVKTIGKVHLLTKWSELCRGMAASLKASYDVLGGSAASDTCRRITSDDVIAHVGGGM